MENPKEKIYYNEDAAKVYARMGNFYRLPKILRHLWEVEENDEQHRHVPATFCKFIAFLWTELESPRKGKRTSAYWWSASLSMRQFPMRPNDAAWWMTAIENSNLFRVKRGTAQNRKPTIIRYNRNANTTDWKGFYLGLMAACDEVRKIDKTPNLEEWGKIVRRNVDKETPALIEQEGGESSKWATSWLD